MIVWLERVHFVYMLTRCVFLNCSSPGCVALCLGVGGLRHSYTTNTGLQADFFRARTCIPTSHVLVLA